MAKAASKIRGKSQRSTQDMRVLTPTRAKLEYDAVRDTKRRKAPVSRLRSEDKELTGVQREKLVTGSRDIHRNFAIVRWAVRKHLDYITSFTFQCRSQDNGLNNEIEALMKWWGQAQNCDIARRHPFRRMIRLAEAHRVVDGDCFLVKQQDGHLQAVEGDRVRKPTRGGLPDGVDANSLTEGVVHGTAGEAQSYMVCNRTKSNGFEFARIIPAQYVIHHANFSRFDQLRGISEIASALNTYRDVYEGIDYALAKAKISQIFGLAFYREADEAVDAGADEDEDEDTTYANYDFAQPQILDLDPGDRAEFLESKSPAAEFKDFMVMCIEIALKALDIPFSFFDESFTNWSGQRTGWIQYEFGAMQKRADVRDMLNAITYWKINQWVLNGTLRLPGRMRVTEIPLQWMHAGVPWLQPLTEVKAAIEEIQAGLTTWADVLHAKGKDFHETIDALAEQWQYIQSKGVPVKLVQEALRTPGSDEGKG